MTTFIPCKEQKQKLQEAIQELFSIAEKTILPNEKLAEMPDELRNAIQKFDEAKEEYQSCLKDYFEDSDWDAIKRVTSVL